MERDALISPCSQYRYWLLRRWSNRPLATFVMLNPSTADANSDDATIRKCMGFADAWGLGGIWVVNLFALRSTNPYGLVSDEVGRRYALDSGVLTRAVVPEGHAEITRARAV